MARRRRPDDVKSAAKGFQQILDPKKAPAGFTEQDILRSRSDPSRYGGIYEGAAPSAAPAARKAPAARPAPAKAAPARRPGGGGGGGGKFRDPDVTGTPGMADIDRGGIPPGMQVGQEPYSDRYPSGFGTLPGPPDLPGPLNLPNFAPPPPVTGLTPSVDYGRTAPPPQAGPPPGPVMGQPMVGAAPADAAGGAIPLPGGAPVGNAPSFAALGQTQGTPPPGLLDALGKYWAGMKSAAAGGM